MNMSTARLSLCCLAVALAGCGTVSPWRDSPASAVKPKHVVFIGWDGFAAHTLKEADVPTLRRLMAEGAWTDRSRSILPSASACNWRSLFTCSASEQHGYVAWNSKEPAFPAADTPVGARYPDIFRQLRQERPDAESVILYEWGGIAATVDVTACSHHEQLPGSNLVAAACACIRTRKPTFLAVCYDSPDHAGHAFGWGSPEYHRRVTELDRELAEILSAIDDAGLSDETVVIVTSDHGGKDKKHGGATIEEIERPLFLYGKGVRRGCRLSFGGTVYDTGATIAALLGLTPPRAWIGRPLDEAF